MALKRIGELLENYGSKTSQSSDDSFSFVSLIQSWEKIVGSKLSKHTIPLKNQQKNLTILSDHPVYSQQLSFLQNPIKEKIFKNFPPLKNKISYLKFVVNESYFKQQLNTFKKNKKESVHIPHAQSPEYKAVHNEASKAFKNFKNEEIKEKMISLYIQQHFNKPN